LAGSVLPPPHETIDVATLKQAMIPHACRAGLRLARVRSTAKVCVMSEIPSRMACRRAATIASAHAAAGLVILV
jgi:hypothetical protein